MTKSVRKVKDNCKSTKSVKVYNIEYLNIEYLNIEYLNIEYLLKLFKLLLSRYSESQNFLTGSRSLDAFDF
ncbi:hypothetical protein ASJ81_00805 [Methanosarcina spelaei]|uniref:Uncharacterized protein n=1 Tax=Methanosarcina spelaei TaxID=1036679 RepID=A0A2A2HV75_9EURY|nr:hypothetical protein ASJ81_00805 [Methanosarcina spelaei]